MHAYIQVDLVLTNSKNDGQSGVLISYVHKTLQIFKPANVSIPRASGQLSNNYKKNLIENVSLTGKKKMYVNCRAK